MKIRFIEPANTPYKKSLKNHFVYDENIRTPSNGIITLATILKPIYGDVFCYSESISEIKWNDVFDADIIFISIFTFNANRGYKLARYIRRHSKALIVFGGLHATLNYKETAKYCDYVLRGEGDELIVEFTKECITISSKTCLLVLKKSLIRSILSFIFLSAIKHLFTDKNLFDLFS